MNLSGFCLQIPVRREIATNVLEVTLSISDNLITVTSPNLFNSSRICFVFNSIHYLRRRQPWRMVTWMRQATQPPNAWTIPLLIIRGSHMAGLPLYCIRRIRPLRY